MTTQSFKKAVLISVATFLKAKISEAPVTFVLIKISTLERNGKTNCQCLLQNNSVVPHVTWQMVPDGLTAKKEETYITIYPSTVASLHNTMSQLHIHFFSSDPTSQPSRSEMTWIICKNINQISLKILGTLTPTQISKMFEADLKFIFKWMSACPTDSSSRRGFQKESCQRIFKKSSWLLGFLFP